MEDAQFDHIADNTLRSLLAVLDELDDLEAELEQGVLTIQFPKGGMAFVVNSHRAARQIWLAADRNAWHFDPSADGAAWLNSKAPHQELRTVLGEALSRRLGQPVALLLAWSTARAWATQAASRACRGPQSGLTGSAGADASSQLFASTVSMLHDETR